MRKSKKTTSKLIMMMLALVVVFVSSVGVAFAAVGITDLKAVCDESGTVTLTGVLKNDGTALDSKQVTMKVEDPTLVSPASIVAIDQITTGTGADVGEFTFSFTIKDVNTVNNLGKLYRLSVGATDKTSADVTAMFKPERGTVANKVVINGSKVVATSGTATYNAKVYDSGKNVVPGAALTWSLSSNPNGSSIIAGTGVFTAGATDGDVTVQVSNGAGVVGTFAVKVTTGAAVTQPADITGFNKLYNGALAKKALIASGATFNVPAFGGTAVTYEKASLTRVGGGATSNATVSSEGLFTATDLTDGSYKLVVNVLSSGTVSYQQVIFFGVGTASGSSIVATSDTATTITITSVPVGTTRLFYAPKVQLGEGLNSSKAWIEIDPSTTTIGDLLPGTYVLSAYVGNGKQVVKAEVVVD